MKPSSGPSLSLEMGVYEESGFLLIAGLDEAGRGAIAGPVMAAAVILPLDQKDLLRRLNGVDDSKRISPSKREELYGIITEQVLTWGVGSTDANEIDHLGIAPANASAMEKAIDLLDPFPEFLLIDGRMRLRNRPLPQRSIIRGDSHSLSIAAASILAKVSRDRVMVVLDQQFPEYGFAQHKGYCTEKHVAALSKYGPCPIHRRSFAPLRQTLWS